MSADSAEPLVKQFDSSLDLLKDALSSPDFYIELLFIVVSLSVAILMATLIRRYMRRQLQENPSRFPSDIIMGPLALLEPALAILYLGVTKPFAERYSGSAEVTSALIKLSFAFFLIRLITLTVKSRFIAWLISVVIFVISVLAVTGFLPSTTAYLKSLSFSIGKFEVSLLGVIQGIVIFIIVFWLAGALNRAMNTYLQRVTALNYSTRELLSKFFTVFVYFVAIVITLGAMGVDLTAFAVFGGALGVGVGLGLQRITSNFVSGITLLMERSIKIGDLIEVSGFTGFVRQLHMRYALLETADGRELMIPNEELISTRVTNWTYSTDRARIEIKVGVAYGSDARLVKELLIKAASEHPLCLRDPQPVCWLREFADSSINFVLTFWIPDVKEGRFGPQSDVMIAILDKLKEHNITIPFPQREVRILNTDASDVKQ